MEYTETNEFLKKVITLKTQLKDASKKEKKRPKRDWLRKRRPKQRRRLPLLKILRILKKK